MGVKAISLPDELIKELDDAAKMGNRGFSAEVRMRCESFTTGVDGGRLDSMIEICGDKVPIRLTAGVEESDVAKLKVRVGKIVVEQPIANGKTEDVVLKEVADNYFSEKPFKSFMKKEVNGKFDGVSELAKKIAKEVPGVEVASKLTLELNEKQAKFMETTISNKNSSKSRLGSTGRVELIKGFWRETFASVGDAIIEADQKGWKESEYQIKPVD